MQTKSAAMLLNNRVMNKYVNGRGSGSLLNIVLRSFDFVLDCTVNGIS